MNSVTQDNCTLLPCPFCGGEASLGTVSYTEKTVAEQQWEQDTFHKVNCIICGTDNCGLVGHKTAEKAAAAWNKRATPPADMEGAVEAHETVVLALRAFDDLLSMVDCYRSGGIIKPKAGSANALTIAAARQAKDALTAAVSALQRDEWRDVCWKLVAAWDALPGGHKYSPDKIEKWLNKDIGPAMRDARAALLAAPVLADQHGRQS